MTNNLRYGKPLSSEQLDILIERANTASGAAQDWIDSHRGGEVDAQTEALYEATYQLCARLEDIIINNLAPQVEGLIDMSKAYK